VAVGSEIRSAVAFPDREIDGLKSWPAVPSGMKVISRRLALSGVKVNRSVRPGRILDSRAIITLTVGCCNGCTTVLLAGSMEIAPTAGYAHADQVKKDLIHSDAGSELTKVIWAKLI